MFDRLKNYYLNIRLAIELNPSRFLETKLANINGAYKFNVYRKKYKTTFTMDLQNSKTLNEIQLMAIFIVQKEYRTLTNKSL